ncbi:amidase domain-containing protein [Ureibacillus composti]
MPTYYNRAAAVAYAQAWWNGNNPNYPAFTDDCTNFISQCLRAGGAPMTGYPNRARGWWITEGWRSGARGNHYPNETWSYSWAVANAFMSNLQNSKSGLTAKQVQSPSELEPGDVICYDFEGDGRINHTTIVTSVYNGVPYINAHTVGSANRHYSYADSYAYTPNIRYYYFKIDDVFN